MIDNALTRLTYFVHEIPGLDRPEGLDQILAPKQEPHFNSFYLNTCGGPYQNPDYLRDTLE
ncbi:MAG: hypothetical protein KDK51_09780 [Deltaproteobacteria bacterium]|nr:hypothetical protein [Deltaproteobacteria bacterium]